MLRAQNITVHETDDHARDGVEDDDLSGTPAVNGERHADTEDSGRQLLQLVQRKWHRVYAVLFVREMLIRVALVAYAWGAIIARAGYVSAGTQFALFCGARDNADARLATVGSCVSLRNLVIVLTVGALYMLVFHGWRLIAYGGPSIRHALRGSKGSSINKSSASFGNPTRLSHRAAAYVAGHSGLFGRFYVATLLLASACISIAGLVDVFQGWANATVLYAFGGFFA